MSLSWPRRVVPNWWRSSVPEKKYIAKGIKKPSPALQPLSETEELSLQQSLKDFSNEPSLGVAADTLRFSPRLNHNDTRLHDVANYILARGTEVPHGLRALANKTLQGTTDQICELSEPDVNGTVGNEVGELRRRLATYPKDALTWLDIGRMHASNGNLRRAGRAIEVALNLQGQDRLVLRSSARFYLHAREPDRALSILHKSPRTPHDPWLMATHIAISSIVDKKSQYIGKGRKIIKSGNSIPWEVSELAMSLGSLEFQDGATRNARKLFDFALRAPNQNVLAQSEWAARELNIQLVLPDEWLNDPGSVEAAYYRELTEGNFENALANAVKWHRAEPFASRPMIAASFLAVLNDNIDDSIRYARQGLSAEGDNIYLLNNLAFALALSGDLVSASNVMKKVSRLERGSLSEHTIANLGMMSLLLGNIDEGERLYNTAIKRLETRGIYEAAAIAASCRSCFSKLASSPRADINFQEAKELSKKATSAVSQAMFKKFTGVDGSGLKTLKSLSVNKWEYDKERNILKVEHPKPFGSK